MIPQKVTIETSLRVFQYKLLNSIIYFNIRLSKFDPAVNPLRAYYTSRSRSNSGSCR